MIKISKEILDKEKNSVLNVSRCAKFGKNTVETRVRSWLAKRIVFDILQQNSQDKNQILFLSVSISDYSSCIALYNESLRGLEKSIKDLKNQPNKQNEELKNLYQDPIFIEFKELYERIYGRELSNIEAIQRKIICINSYLSSLDAKNQLPSGFLNDQNHGEVNPKRQRIQ